MVASSHLKTARSLARKGHVRESLDEIDRALGEELDDLERIELRKLRTELVDHDLWTMVKAGAATWSGGKPKGSNPPIDVTPGPPISDFIHQMRD